MNDSLHALISQMKQEDQDKRRQIRQSKDALNAELRQLDRENTTELKKLIKQCGWPEVIKEGREATWMLIQHADHDTAFQKQAYRALRQYGQGLIDPWQIAALYDRILLNKHDAQKFGTQLIKDYANKTWVPTPLRNPEKVNEYRASVGLGAIEEYVAEFNQKYPFI